MPKKVKKTIGQRKKRDNWWMGKNRDPKKQPNSLTTPRQPSLQWVNAVVDPIFLSDAARCSWFFSAETCTEAQPSELVDSDGNTADEFFVVLDKVHKYNPVAVDVDELYVQYLQRKFITLRTALMESDIDQLGFNFVSTDKGILLIQLYTEDIVSVKLTVRVTSEFKAHIHVHRVELSSSHDLWLGAPKHFDELKSVYKLLSQINKYSVCIGNPDDQYLNKAPQGLSSFKESDMGAMACGIRYRCTVRSNLRDMLCEGVRCKKCSSYRSTLRKMVSRENEKCTVSKLSATRRKTPNKPYRTMSKEQLIDKCQGLRAINRSIERKNARMRASIKEQLKFASAVDDATSADLVSIMNSKTSEMENAYPDPNSYERLFWDEQLKVAQLKDSRLMKWHPMMIKWCLHLQSKSSAAYDSLRDSGFIKLPSSRTLYDYSHFLTSGAGFQPDVVEHLVKEMSVLNIKEDWQKYAGILFDEIKIKSDLVYDKHSGELVGYVNLDKIGNELIQLENGHKPVDTASHILVLMVRGMGTRLKYPFAHFATTSITADFIFLIIQQALEILEIDCGLKVLFITCDGASANRKFFNLHQLPNAINDSVVYCTENPYSVDERYIYFISDVPHLLKTARNCLANSGSHKKSRHLWNDGDVSWMHIVKLYEDHCSGLYKVVPKLTPSHINLTSFSCMKVNLAAQVFSGTVASALQTFYGENVSKTVELIKHMNRFFDCLNTKNLNEGQRKRNPDLEPYRDVDDERLSWLMNDFLSYFNDWKCNVMSRDGQFTLAERNKMLLSPQTCTGLEISVKSIVSCVKFLLTHNVPFVLTECFNQDPLEQHFGIHRQSCGGNDNPTLYEFNHNMTRLRAIGSEALAPVRGNTKRGSVKRLVDSTPLPKKVARNKRLP